MAIEFDTQSDTFSEKLKNANWKKIGLHHALPLVVAFTLGGVIFGAGSGSSRPNYSDEIILSDVDLPSQISKLQNAQLTVLESQLKRIGEQVNLADSRGVSGNEDKATMVLSTLNYDNNLTNFFKTLLSFDSESDPESQYTALATFLENPVSGGTGDNQTALQEKESLLAFIQAQSWAKETTSRTALAGSVIPALLTGSTDDNKLYLVIVPATNDKREFRNLSYVVSLGKNNKVRRLVYQGEIENNANLETWYRGLESVVANNVSEFVYSEQPSYEERRAEENLVFLQKIKAAFGLVNDGDKKQIRLEGQKIVVGSVKDRTLDQMLKDDYGLSDDQIKAISQSIAAAKEADDTAKKEEKPKESTGE